MGGRCREQGLSRQGLGALLVPSVPRFPQPQTEDTVTVKSQQTRAHSAQHAATLRRWLSTRETVIAMKRLAKVTRTVCGRDWHWWRSHTGKPKPFLRPGGGGGACSSQRARVSARPRRGDQLCAGRWLREGRRVPAGPESSSRTLGWRGGNGARALRGSSRTRRRF